MNFNSIRNTIKSTISATPAFVLFPAFLVFLAILLPPTRNYSYFLDDLISFEHVEKVSHHLSAIWDANTNQRRHPIFFLLLFLESRLFGSAPTGYFLVLFFIHFCNALLVVKLARRFGVEPPGALVGGLLFLCSSVFYQALIFIPTTLIVLSLSFFLLGIEACMNMLREIKLSFTKMLIFQTLALLSYEVSIVFPLMAGFLSWQYVDEPKKRLKIFMFIIAPLILIETAVFFFIAKDFSMTTAVQSKVSAEGLSLFFPRLASLVRMLLGPLFIPDKNFLFLDIFNNPFLRITPLALCSSVLGALLLTRKEVLEGELVSKKIMAVCLGWIGIAILPHMANQLTFEHTTRHLYFAMVGFSILFGAFANNLFRRFRSLCPIAAVLIFGTMLAYILTLNLVSTAHHYQRYQKFAQEHPQYSYGQQVQQLFNNPKASKNQLLNKPDLS